LPLLSSIAVILLAFFLGDGLEGVSDLESEEISMSASILRFGTHFARLLKLNAVKPSLFCLAGERFPEK
jgi:hypothetical protein